MKIFFDIRQNLGVTHYLIRFGRLNNDPTFVQSGR